MTFSIAARCARTGEIGQALATSSMSAIYRSMAMAPMHGAVFVQARSDPRLCDYGCGLLKSGLPATDVLKGMREHAAEADPWRQIGVIDASGNAAHNTGERCIASKGAYVGSGVIVIGNGLANDEVLPAMLQGFEGSDPERPLIERLLEGLFAGEAAGGEPHALRCAGIRIGRANVPVPSVDLRVDLDDAPLEKLRHYWKMYEPMMDGYLARVLHPATAPFAAEIEAHIR